MKSKICVILLIITLAFATSSHQNIERNKTTLNRRFEIFKNGLEFDANFDEFDLDCIREKLKLTENGEKEILSLEGTFLVSKAADSCSVSGEVERIKKMLKERSNRPMFRIGLADIHCTKYILQKLNSNLKLIQEFIPESMNEDERKFCEKKSKFEEFMGKFVVSEELEFPRIWNDIDYISNFTCGAASFNKLKEFYFIKEYFGIEEKSKIDDSDVENVATALVRIADNVFNCRMSKINGK